MAEIDPLTLKIIADTKGALKDVANFQRVTGQGLNRVERDVLKLEAQMKRSSGAIGNSLKGIAGTLGTLFTGRELVGMIDGFTRLQNSLRVAGLEGQQLEQVQSKLVDMSAKYGVSINELAGLFGKATQSGKELGASQDQLLQITEASAQALKITGTSAAQAQGALLGLTQALSSGTVRAEEYNQILEGGLQPLLQVAANTDKYGGSLARLRQAVVDGKVSSQELYQSILAGSAQLEGQASKATLTLAGAFEALTSKLTVYIGQSAQANGATAALAGALTLLADNIDVLIPALAVIAALMGTSLVVNALAGTRAFFALTAAMGGAATAAEALAFALGTAGVGAAIVAVGAGLIYLASQSENATMSMDELKAANARNSAELDGMIGRLKAAGVNTDALGNAADRAADKVDGLSEAYRNALIEARKFSNETSGGKIQKYNDDIIASQGRQAVLTEYLRAQRAANPGAVREGRKSPQIVQAERKLGLERDLETGLRKLIDARATGNAAGVNLDSSPAGRSTPTATAKPKKTRSARTGATTDPLDAVFRNAQDLRQLQLEELRAQEQATTSTEERARFAREALALERDGRLADVNESERKKQLTADEAKARRAIIENLYGAGDEIKVQAREAAYQAAITRAEQEAIARQQTDAMRDELDALGAEAGITDVRTARVAIERRMLEIQQQIERALLDEAIARGDVLDAAQARAALGRKQSAERTGFDRGSAGPLGQYVEELRKAGLNLDDQFEGVAVNGLRSLNDGLADAIANSKNLGEVFKNVAQSIIADLIRIAIQQTIVNALQSAFGGGGGGGGTILNVAGTAAKFAGKTPGARAGGGPVAAGNLYRINEAGMEYFQPANSGRIIPIGEMNQRLTRSSQESGGGTVHVIIEEGPNFMSTIRTEATGVSLEVTRAAYPSMVEGAAQETQRRLSRPRMPGAGR